MCDSLYRTLWNLHIPRDNKTHERMPGDQMGNELGIIRDAGIVLRPMYGGACKNPYVC